MKTETEIAADVREKYRLDEVALQAPMRCRRCSECQGQDHHWMDDCPEWFGPRFICKHCEAISPAVECDFCDEIVPAALCGEESPGYGNMCDACAEQSS